MSSTLSAPLKLPCGAVIKNRVAKSAMTEGLGDAAGRPTAAHATLYAKWSDGGAGLLLTGNVIVDHRHLERPGNVVIAKAPDAEMRSRLKAWTTAGTKDDTHLWMQISHAGRQTQTLTNPNPKAPSAVPLELPGKQFGMPEPLSESEIVDLIQRFILASQVAMETGFTGVQIHAAHGYLISQFLSPRANRRTDKWGGSLENRARFLMEITKGMRRSLGNSYPISVKLNSADFQKGGFAFEDSLVVARWLEEAGIDLIEVSGGSYEQPKMMNLPGLESPDPQSLPESTMAREAYFADFAKAIRASIKIPVLLTGGIRSMRAAEHVLQSGAADMVGLGRPMCVDPDAPNQLLNGAKELSRWEDKLKLLPSWASILRQIPIVKAIDGFAVMYWYYAQIDRMARSGRTDPSLTVFKAMREVDGYSRKLAKEIAAANK